LKKYWAWKSLLNLALAEGFLWHALSSAMLDHWLTIKFLIHCNYYALLAKKEQLF